MTRKTAICMMLIMPVLVCFSAGVASAQGTLYYVNTTSDSVVSGACQNGNPGCSLRGAIQLANSHAGDDGIEISIPLSDPNCLGGVCFITLSQALPDISTNISITGPGADKLTVRVLGGVNARVFNVISASTGLVDIRGLTISGGDIIGRGGGISHTGGGTVNVLECVISLNRATGTIGDGGGIYNAGFQMNLTNSTVNGNYAQRDGGGIYNTGTNPSTVVANSTITGNLAERYGGGIANTGIFKVTNGTIAYNSAIGSAEGSKGGGIYNTSFGHVKSSIIALNTVAAPFDLSGPDVSGSFFSYGFNLIGKVNSSVGFNDVTDQAGTIAAPLDAKLASLGPQNNGGPTKTIAPLCGSPAIDKGTSNGLTGNLTTDQRGVGFPRTFDKPAITNAAGGNGTDIGAFEMQQGCTRHVDFDGDGKTDIGIFRPNATAEWWINRSSNGVTFALQFGASTDKIAPADYTGDGKADITFWRPSTGEWYVLRSEDNSFFAFPFGASGDIPAPADYDADGKADAAVFRPSSATWFISQSGGGGTRIFQFGINGDQPVVSDYDGDGKADVGIFRPGPREWWISRSTAGLLAMQFGNAGDKAVQGDYTGDGKTDVAIWRPSTGEWFIVRSEDFSFYGFPFGANGDVPAPGDYDGDGKTDPTVFRPSQATWFIARSSAGTLITQFGANGDRPIPNAFVP